MSACEDFTQNAWRKDLCRNCLRPKCEHSLNSVEKKSVKPGTTLKTSGGKENTYSKTNSRNSVRNDKLQNGVIDDVKKPGKIITNREGSVRGVKGCVKEKSKNLNDTKISGKKFDTKSVKSKVESKSGTQNLKPSSALKKVSGPKKSDFRVKFFIGDHDIISEEGGINGLDSDDVEYNVSSDDEEVKAAPLSREDKALAKLTFDNTQWNSERENLQPKAPPVVNSLQRCKSIGSQEFLEIEDALLWHPKTFSNYVNPETNAHEKLISRKSPPPNSPDERVVVPNIDIGENSNSDSKAPSVGKPEELLKHDNVFRLSGMQPRMNLAKPYKVSTISPSSVVLPFPANDSFAKNPVGGTTDQNVKNTSRTVAAAKNSGADSKTENKTLKNSSQKPTTAKSANQIQQDKNKSTNQVQDKNKSTNQIQDKQKPANKLQDKPKVGSGSKTVSKSVNKESPVSKGAVKKTESKVNAKIVSERKSSLGSTGSNSPKGSPAGARKPWIKTVKNAKTTTPPGGLNKKTCGQNSVKSGPEKVKGLITSESGKEISNDALGSVASDAKVERIDSKDCEKSPSDIKKELVKSEDVEKSEVCQSETCQNLLTAEVKSGSTDLDKKDSASQLVAKKDGTLRAGKPIKRPAPPPPPPPTGKTENSAKYLFLRSSSVPTPPIEETKNRSLAMASRTVSVDSGSKTPKSDRSIFNNKKESTTPKKNKLSSGSFLRKFLKKSPQKSVEKAYDCEQDQSTGEVAGFAPTWCENSEIEFIDDSFSDDSYDEELFDSVDVVEKPAETKLESPGDWNDILKNFGTSDFGDLTKLGENKNHSESKSTEILNDPVSQERTLKINRHSDGSLERSEFLPKDSKKYKRKSSADSAKLESPQRKWDPEKLETLRKSRDISSPILVGGKPQNVPLRPVSFAVKNSMEPLSEAKSPSPRPKSLEKSPSHDVTGRATLRKPIKKPPAPPPPIPVHAQQRKSLEDSSGGSVKSCESSGSGTRVLPLETMTLDRKSLKNRASPRPTSTGETITRPKPPPPPPPTTLPRTSPDKAALPRRPPPPKFKPTSSRDPSPKPESHVYEEYGTRHVRGSKTAAPPTTRHQYEYIFDKPGKGRPKDLSPAPAAVTKGPEIGLAYEPVSVSPEEAEEKPITGKPKPPPQTKANMVPKPKRTHLYEVIHPDDRSSNGSRSGRTEKPPPLPVNGRYEAVVERPRARKSSQGGKHEGDENIYDVVEVPPIPVLPPESPSSISRCSRSFEDYLVPIRRGSIDQLDSGTDDEILETDTLGSLPELPITERACSALEAEKKDDTQSVGLLESVLQKLKEPKSKMNRKMSAPEKQSKKLFSRSLTRRPRSARHNSLPEGCNIVLLKQDTESMKSGSTGSVEEYVDMTGGSGKEDDPSPSSTGSIGDANSSPMLPRAKPPTGSVRGRTCLPAPPTQRGQIEIGESNLQDLFSNIANMNLQTLNQVLRDMEVPKKVKGHCTNLTWESFDLETEVPLMRTAALAFYKATLQMTMEQLVLMVSFEKVPDDFSSKYHCNGLKQRCTFEDEIPCQFLPDSILQQIVGANTTTALTSHCQITVLEYTNITTLEKYLDKFSDNTDEYFHEVCFILVQILQYSIHLLDRGYEFSNLTAASLLITTSGQSKNHVLLNPGQVHAGNGDNFKSMCQEIVTLILKLHEIDSFEIYDKMSHLPYKKTVQKITQLLNSCLFSSMVQGLDMLGFVLWGPTKELRQLQRSNSIALDCQCWLDVECAKMVNSLARGEDRDSIWTYYHLKYLCEMDGRKLATICDTYNLGTR